MKFVIEFYRIRAADDAHAVVGREMALATGLDDAIEIARLLARTLNMPQWPDAVFTGIPAHVDGTFMTGLTRAEATRRMLALNLRNTGRQRQWNAARPFAREHAETPAGRP